ncbi:MAG: Rrf2 family transcriptional regulator [Rhodospirillaceae bacterium]|jgi:Rrf2 family protein|nr:Rrf2 family transcriptional regulator [Rhodospirillaceae bacterium]
MKLQQATRCALFAVFELARDPARQLAAAEIADKYDLSVNHLAKVLRELSRAKIINSVRGAGGGYTFAANPKRLTLYEIVSRFEDIHPDEAEAGASGGVTGVTGVTDATRALGRVLTEIDGITASTLKSISVATFLKLGR